MDPTSLKRLIEEGGVEFDPGGLTVTLKPSWIIEGEDRLSYTTLVRLVECCREHHWNVDILPWAGNSAIDATTRTIAGEFISTIPTGSVISIAYQVVNVGQKSYSLRFQVHDKIDHRLCATFDLVLVFYDAVTNKSVYPPKLVLDHLCAISTSNSP